MLTEASRRDAGSFFFGLDFCRRRPVVRQSGRFDTFVAKIFHFVHFFVRKVAFQRERAYIRCAEIILSIMLERIQYVLFVLLFVLAGSLDGATSQGGACRVQPGLSPQAALHAPVTAQNYFTAAVMLSGDASIEIPAHSSEHKAIVRPVRLRRKPWRSKTRRFRTAARAIPSRSITTSFLWGGF